jgi:hypothetical protein
MIMNHTRYPQPGRWRRVIHRARVTAASRLELVEHGGMSAQFSESCRLLLAAQAGAVARWQAASIGLNLALIDVRLRRRQWQPLYRGVYATFTGPPSRECFLWAAVLRGGPGAALSYSTAAELDGLTEVRAGAIHVTVLPERRIALSQHERGADVPPIILHASARLGVALHPARTPPRTRVEETVLDLFQASASFDDALSWPVAACARRRTTHGALIAATQARARLRWRAALLGALGEIGNGVHSLLEFRYARGVERPHGLPAARRQARMSRGSRSQYLDNFYEEFGVAVELDGRAAHRAEDRRQDNRRDNFFASVGIVTLRYGWADVTERPCQLAAEIGQVLRERGWTGSPSRCGPACGS